jgi:hypothetical protein
MNDEGDFTSLGSDVSLIVFFAYLLLVRLIEIGVNFPSVVEKGNMDIPCPGGGDRFIPYQSKIFQLPKIRTSPSQSIQTVSM